MNYRTPGSSPQHLEQLKNMTRRCALLARNLGTFPPTKSFPVKQGSFDILSSVHSLTFRTAPARWTNMSSVWPVKICSARHHCPATALHKAFRAMPYSSLAVLRAVRCRWWNQRSRAWDHSWHEAELGNIHHTRWAPGSSVLSTGAQKLHWSGVVSYES